MMKRTKLLISSILFMVMTQAGAASYSSTVTRNTLLELYTSEGCSSCPRADRWLSRLKQDPRLWKTLFPIAFHVDYWDYLGWKDSYSSKDYSARQRHYASLGYAGSVYTPGFFQNGREWRQWFVNPELSIAKPARTGKLTATVTPREINAAFSPTTPPLKATTLHVAILGFNKITHVRGGENSGKQLLHDFVALSLNTYEGKDNLWHINEAVQIGQLEQGEAILFWVTTANDPTPLQVIGGWLANQR